MVNSQSKQVGDEMLKWLQQLQSPESTPSPLGYRGPVGGASKAGVVCDDEA